MRLLLFESPSHSETRCTMSLRLSIFFISLLIFIHSTSKCIAAPFKVSNNTPASLSKKQSSKKQDDNDLHPNTRIINGDPVLSKAEFPFVVDISNSDTDISSRRFCTGTLIDPTTVLTAAHCVINQGYTSPVYATIGRIQLQDYHQHNNPSLTYRTVSSMVHPLYDGIGSPYDVAILSLNESCESVQPVSLSTAVPSNNSITWVVGYGIQRIGTIEEVSQSVEVLAGRLQKTQLRIIDRDACDIPQAELRTKKGLLCTKGLKAGASACMGDSGGGLFLKLSDNSNAAKRSKTISKNENITQVGIVSYGDSNCASEESGVFTEVSHVRRWIRSASAQLQSLSNSSASSLLHITLDDDVIHSDYPSKEFSHRDHVQGKMLIHYKSDQNQGKNTPQQVSIPEAQAVIATTAHHAKYYTVSTNFSKPTDVTISLCKSPPGTVAHLSVRNERSDRMLSDEGSCPDGKLSQLVVPRLKVDRLVVGVSGNGTLPIRLTFSSEKVNAN